MSRPTLPIAAVLLAALMTIIPGRNAPAEDGLPAQVFADPGAEPIAARPKAALVSLKLYPPEINLATAPDRQSIVVQATYADGITRDVTREATITLDTPELVRRVGT